MTQLGEPVSQAVRVIREIVERVFFEAGYACLDANSETQGRDFLLKIWELVVSTPVGIAIIAGEMSRETLANVFYELGWMQSLGKETLVVKSPGIRIPSDFIRTEYVEYDGEIEGRLRQFTSYLGSRAEYFLTVADQLDRNPLLQIDYCRRAFLLTGDVSVARRASDVLRGAGLRGRAKNSVEMLLAGFALSGRARDTIPPASREASATSD